jgi:hypothetical protein
MRTRSLWLLPLALALPLAAQDKAAPPMATAERAKASGVEVSANAAAPKKGVRTRCVLTLSPNSAANGATFSFSVAYTPCLPVAETEVFTFPWASTLPGFTEVTVREKIFKTSVGCVASSFDSTLVPTAGAIKGTFTAKVVVRNTATHAVICTATAPMTVP